MHRAIIAISGILWGTHVAAAAPPANADMTLAPWYQSLMVPDNGTEHAGHSCCNLADCRPVRYRTTGAHYEAYIDDNTFDQAPNRWVTVPDEVVIRKDNPTGEAVLCYYKGAVRCFVPASGA